MTERPAKAATEWRIAVRSDGVIASVEGGAPAAWLGKLIVEAKGSPDNLVVVGALPLRRGPVRVHELVMRTVDLFASQAKSNNIELQFEQAAGVPSSVVVDSEKMAWALATLVVNALRYTKTRVGVRASWKEASSELVLEVSDDGPGMPEEKTRWLFEADPSSGRSSGLALVMVRDVMTAHRGTVTVQSRVGRGTTFTLTAPQPRDASPESAG